MKGNSKRRNFYFFLSIFLTNLTTSITIPVVHELKIKDSKSYLDIPYIENNDDECKNWIPSLFNPISLAPSYIDLPNSVPIDETEKISIPIIGNGQTMTISYLNFTFLGKYNISASKERNFTSYVNKCYFGLLNKKGDYTKLNKSSITLEQLSKEKQIEKKIFSFDKWNISEDKAVKSNFYYGDLHQHFNSKKKYIGNCRADKVDKYWGCFFNEISINDTIIDLKKNDFEYYPIYFTSESFNITFPRIFKEKFENQTKDLCKYEEDKDKKEPKFSCNDNIFIDEEVALLKLIDNDTIITTEIDNLYRFNHSNEEGKNMTRIIYNDKIDYFIFPLIMFKNFHIQFDAENNLISFYTTNRTILTLKNIKDDDDDEGSSNGLIITLIIIIILIVIVIGLGIFLFFRKRRGALENNINKYNKFEDEENFQSMNEKRVF